MRILKNSTYKNLVWDVRYYKKEVKELEGVLIETNKAKIDTNIKLN